MFHWGAIGLFAGGCLAGSYGMKLLGSKDAKKVYTHITAAALRAKDTVVRDMTTIRENAEDICAAAKDINEERVREEEARIIEDAKAVLASAKESAAAGDVSGAEALTNEG